MNGSIDMPRAQRTGATGVSEPVDHGGRLVARVDAVEAFIEVAGRLVAVGDLKWVDVDADYRLLAINVALRRQLESIRAAVVLARQDLGHLAVAFVRASLEDVIYLSFFVSLALDDSQKLFLLLGNWDMTRSLLAQRAYVGDDVMKELWYPTGFLDAVQLKRDEVRSQLKELQSTTNGQGVTSRPAHGLPRKPARRTSTTICTLQRAARCTSLPAKSCVEAGAIPRVS
jgi:hypothetical protein